MGQYSYSNEEKKRNKVLRYNQISSETLQAEQERERAVLDERTVTSEELLKSLGYGEQLEQIGSYAAEGDTQQKSALVLPEWEALVAEAEAILPRETELEDILTQEEFRHAYADLNRIENDFSAATKLTGADISILIVATALQSVRSILFGHMAAHLNSVERIGDRAGDELVKGQKRGYVEAHDKKWRAEKEAKGRRPRAAEGKTWKEIVFAGVPYDVTKGSKALGINMEASYHRYKTLGHDPILGWIFGTANILTETITLTHPFQTLRVSKGTIQPEIVPVPVLFGETWELATEGEHLLPAALFRQALHYRSDFYTRRGLPLPMIEVFSEKLAGKLYKEGYDALKVLQDTGGALSAASAVLFNMLITLLHGLFFCPTQMAKEDEGLWQRERELYEVRTRKILLLSNALATTSNVTVAAIEGNPGEIDLGGLLVTISRLFSDVRFIARVKEEFIQRELDRELRQELEELDALWAQMSEK